jgi:hypothetical protein
MAGAAIGASAASSSAQASSTASYQSGYAAGAAAGSANTTAAYNAGVATGAAMASQPKGTVVTVLPAGAVHTTIGGTTYFVANGVWYQPSSSANGVVYTIVPAP